MYCTCPSMRSCLPTIVEPTKYVETTRSINGVGVHQVSTNYHVQTKNHPIAPECDAIDNEMSSGDPYDLSNKQDAVSQDTSISCYLTGQADTSLYLLRTGVPDHSKVS